MITAEIIEQRFYALKDDAQRLHLMRFFKTGKGQYGEGDDFLGIRVPDTRSIVKSIKNQVHIPEMFPEIKKLLYSTWHEVRLCGLLLLVEKMKANLPQKKDSDEVRDLKSRTRKDIAEFYLTHARQANNWDLVDLSCQYILGPYIRFSKDDNYEILYNLAESDNLWEQRISIVTTLDFIRNGNFTPTLTICDRLLDHQHDLIHKAIGWTLREVGKKDINTLTRYLEKNYSRLPRTSLRYAIERMPESERRLWLTRKP